MKPEPMPQAGGSYTRDEKTGELVKTQPAADTPNPQPVPAAPAQAEKE